MTLDSLATIINKDLTFYSKFTKRETVELLATVVTFLKKI